MLNEIAKNIYLIEVPLPKNPLKALNCYFIKTKSHYCINYIKKLSANWDNTYLNQYTLFKITKI